MNHSFAKAIGNETAFTVEHRILNIILLFGVVLAAASGIFNYFLELGARIIAISLASTLIVLVLYYLSRVRRQYSLTVSLVIAIFGFTVTPLIWFANGGMAGGTAFYVIIFASMMATLIKGWRLVALIASLAAMTLALMVLEYRGVIPVTGYATAFDRYADVAYSLLVTIIANATMFVVLLNYYRREEERANSYLSRIEKQQMAIEMARLDRLNIVGEMAASIGHEVRNPLTTVRGFLQYFKGKKEYSAHISQFDLMIEELDRANSIITEYLSLAKNKKIDLAHTDLNSVILGLHPLIQASALQQGKQVHLDLDYPATIKADANEIRQCLLNLTRNGLEAVDKGGSIVIATRVEGGKVLLFVKDTGKGIPPDIIDKIGTPFLTTKENGAGLGLAVCYKIIERHGATVELETSAAGTTFIIKFALFAQADG